MEANAIFGGGVKLGRQILEDIIGQYINQEDVDTYEEVLQVCREEVRGLVDEILAA